MRLGTEFALLNGNAPLEPGEMWDATEWIVALHCSLRGMKVSPMHATQISDWDLEDRMVIDHRPMAVQFFRTGDQGQDVARAEFEMLADEYPEALFYEIDLVENPSLARKYGLTRGIFTLTPVTMIFVDGVEQTRHVGPLISNTIARILGPRDESTDGDDRYA